MRDPSRREKQRSLLILFMYLAGLWILILEPFDFHPSREEGVPFLGDIAVIFADPMAAVAELGDSLEHLVLFIPFGPLLARCWNLNCRQLLSLRALAIVVPLMLLSELVQVFVSRGTSLFDFSMDFVGYVAGAVLLEWHERSPGFQLVTRMITSPRGLVTGLIINLMMIYLVAAPVDRLPFPIRDLRGWEIHYPLSLGNERTGTRPWRGQMEELVILNRAITPEEVASLPMPPGGHAAELPSDDPAVLAAYSFNPDELRLDQEDDLVEVNSPLGPRLLSAGPGIQTVEDGGISFSRPSILRTRVEPWSQRLEAILDSNAFTLQARLRFSKSVYHDPATIVASSCCPKHFNFSLMQSGDSLYVNVHTIFANGNSSQPTLIVSRPHDSKHSVDLVVTHSHGTTRAYVDGVERAVVHGRFVDRFSSQAFHSRVTTRAAVGLTLVAWGLCFLPLWMLIERRGWELPRSGIVAGIGAVALVLLTGWIAR